LFLGSVIAAFRLRSASRFEQSAMSVMSIFAVAWSIARVRMLFAGRVVVKLISWKNESLDLHVVQHLYDHPSFRGIAGEAVRMPGPNTLGTPTPWISLGKLLKQGSENWAVVRRADTSSVAYVPMRRSD